MDKYTEAVIELEELINGIVDGGWFCTTKRSGGVGD